MGLFQLVSDWKHRLIDEPVDARMAETLKLGLRVARSEVHIITGFLQSTIGGEYNRQTKTIMLHADAKYALIEETRGPTRNYSEHHYLAPAAQAMAEVWGGNFELHFPHALLGRVATGRSLGLVGQERRLYEHLGRRLGKRTKIASRRWHRRWPGGDESGVIL